MVLLFMVWYLSRDQPFFAFQLFFVSPYQRTTCAKRSKIIVTSLLLTIYEKEQGIANEQISQ